MRTNPNPEKEGVGAELAKRVFFAGMPLTEVTSEEGAVDIAGKRYLMPTFNDVLRWLYRMKRPVEIRSFAAAIGDDKKEKTYYRAFIGEEEGLGVFGCWSNCAADAIKRTIKYTKL